MQIKNRQGIRLAVYVEGPEQATTIVFCNSLGTDHRMWDAQAKVFAQHYRVIRFDSRGHGRSELLSPSQLSDYANDVVDILDALAIQQAHIVGLSMGGMTALYLGCYAAERCLSLTVANSAAKIGQAEAWQTRAEQVEQSGLEDVVKTTHLRWFSTRFDYQHNALAQQTIRSLAETPALGYATACRALAEADLRENIAQIALPCLIVVGDNDPVTTLNDGHFLEANIAQSTLVTVATSHLSNVEQALDFNHQLQAFLAGIASLNPE